MVPPFLMIKVRRHQRFDSVGGNSVGMTIISPVKEKPSAFPHRGLSCYWI